MKTHLRRLLMCCLLLLILPMAAFAEENELPVEWVRYGHGLPNPASVDAHGLTEEAITLEGVAYAPKLENGRVYVRLEDLAAAKLVRENGEALQTLGLAVSDLQIENGQLKAPGKEDALAQFLSTAGVGVSLNDSFTLANAGKESSSSALRALRRRTALMPLPQPVTVRWRLKQRARAIWIPTRIPPSHAPR